MSFSNYQFYNGNKKLKQIGQEIAWTPETIEEYRKCKEDVLYFAKNYFKIATLDHGLVLFDPYPFQEEILKMCYDERFIIGKVGRQMGKSTVFSCWILHYVLFNENVSVGVLSNKMKSAKDFMKRIQQGFEELPMWLQQGVKAWNKMDIELENGSRVSCEATTENSGRGGSYNVILLDEFAFVKPSVAEDFMASIYPTISSSTEGKSKLFIISTPKGMNHYYDIWNAAVKKQNNFIPLDVSYKDVPGRDEKWAEDQLKVLGKVRFEQEVNCSFIGSSHTLIDGDCLKHLSKEDPIAIKPNLLIYHHPVPGNRYMITVDPAEGNQGDYTVMTIFDISKLPYKIAGIWRSNTISTLQVPMILYSIAKHYNEAWIFGEINFGVDIINSMIYDFEYENILKISDTKGSHFGRQVLAHPGEYSKKVGVKMSAGVKRLGCATLKNIIENRHIEIVDETLINELRRFVNVKNSYQAETGHDDIVMSLVLFAWATTQAAFKEFTKTDVERKIDQEHLAKNADEIIPFGYISSINPTNPTNKPIPPGFKYDDTFGIVLDTDESPYSNFFNL